MERRTVVVMSDSHGDRSIVQAIKEEWQDKADLIFHNGDSELEVDDSIWDGIHVVAGNMDFFAGYPERLSVDLDGHTIVQTHGHLQNINFTMDKLAYWAQEEAASICLYGHLHVPAAYQEEGILYVNPGSVSQPRGLVLERLYAVLTLEGNQVRVDYYTRDHELFPSLSKEFTIK